MYVQTTWTSSCICDQVPYDQMAEETALPLASTDSQPQKATRKSYTREEKLPVIDYYQDLYT